MTNRDEIKQALIVILRANLNDATLEITDATHPDQVAGWTSIKTVDIVLDAEDAFDVRLSAEDIDSIRTVGNLVDAIERRQTGRRDHAQAGQVEYLLTSSD